MTGLCLYQINPVPIKVIIYEDNDDLRDSLSQTIEENKGLELQNAFPNCEFVKEHMQVYQPDVVLMDIDMPVVNGLEGVKIISQEFPSLPVIMLTIFEDDKNIFEAICNGACGYLLKKSSPEKIPFSAYSGILMSKKARLNRFSFCPAMSS